MADLKLTPQVFENICSRLAEGRSLRSICRDKDIPVEPQTVRQKLGKTPDMYAQYAYARDLGLDSMAEEMLDVAHDGSNDWMEKEGKNGTYTALNGEHVQRSRLRCDSMKWYVSKLAPKRYGDRIQTDVTSSDGTLKGMNQDQIAHKLQMILDSAQKRKEAAERSSTDEAEKRKQEALDELL